MQWYCARDTVTGTSNNGCYFLPSFFVLHWFDWTSRRAARTRDEEWPWTAKLSRWANLRNFIVSLLFSPLLCIMLLYRRYNFFPSLLFYKYTINILKIFYKYIYRLPFNYARNKIKFSSKVPNPSRMRREEVASRVAFDRLPSNRNSEERRRRKRKRRKEE